MRCSSQLRAMPLAVRSVSAPTGQTSTHWPQSSHCSRSGSGYQSLPPARSARRPDGCGTMPLTWMVVQAAQQRPQRMHLE